MATVDVRKDKNGKVTGYRIRACVGRDELTYKQIWRTMTLSIDDERITATTPKKRLDQAQRIADEWGEQKREEYETNHAKIDTERKQKLPLEMFISEKWIPNHVENGKHSPSTKAFYGYMADDIISFFGNHVELKKINREDLERYEKYLRTEAKTQRGKPLSETSIRRHLETLRNVFRYALKGGYIKSDPFLTYQIETKSDEAETVDFLTPDEAKHFLQCLEDESLYWQCMMRIALTNGLRRGELVGLCWQDIDFEISRITVRRNVTVDVKDKNGYHIGSTKAKRQRYAYITPVIKNLLISFREQTKEKYNLDNVPGYSRKPKQDDLCFVFCTPTDIHKPIYPTSPEKWIKRFEQRNGIRAVSMHDLRHSAGTLAKIAGMDLKDIQDMLGHRDLKTTAKYYLGIDEEALRRTADSVESLLMPKEAAKTEDVE